MSQMIDFTLPSCQPGRTLHAFRCVPEGEVRAVLQLSHGMVEFIDRYKPRFAVLRHRLCAVLAQADAVAVAVGGENKRILPGVIRHGERRAPQTERTAQTCARKHLPADGHLRHIARAVQHALAEPPGGSPRLPRSCLPRPRSSALSAMPNTSIWLSSNCRSESARNMKLV